MKHFLILITVIFSFLISSNTYAKPTDDEAELKEIKQIAHDLTEASLRADVQKMTELGNKLLPLGALVGPIDVDANCNKLTYYYNGEEYTSVVCK